MKSMMWVWMAAFGFAVAVVEFLQLAAACR